MVDSPAPPAEQENPYQPPGPSPLVFETFAGLNTEASRPGIQDEQCAWLDGWMPIGKNNARILPGVGPLLYTDALARQIVWYDFGNIGSTPYMVVLLSDGTLVAVNTSTGMVTQIAGTGTILSPSSTAVAMSQWGSLYLIIVANQTNGYWLWDGTNFYQSGTLGPDVTLTNDGLDYTSQPTITAFGGTGSGATFGTPLPIDGSLISISVTNPGTGYSIQDAVVLAFSGGGSPGVTAILETTVSSGTIASVSVVNPGMGYGSLASVNVLGGGGTGGAISVVASAGTISTASITNAGMSYSSNPTPSVVDPNNPVAVATVDLMPTGVQGNAVETYQSRVWIANGAIVTFTAPESVSDFATSDGGGNFQSFDSFLRVGFVSLIQTNGFLYLIGDSSINYVSGVQTSGNPPSTTFTNQNADPEIGTPWPGTVDVFSRNILFANAFGVHVSYGGAVTKISDMLDGIYSTVPNFGGFVPTAAKAIIFGKRVWMLLFPVIDSITGQRVNKLLMWKDKFWWTSQQDINLIFVQHQEINSVITAYGTDGNGVYPLFQNPSIGFTKTIQSKLWERPGGYEFIKTVSRLWGLANYFSPLSPDLIVSIDNETGVSSQTYTLSPNPINVVNASGTIIPVFNASHTLIPTFSLDNGVVVFAPQAVGQNGVLSGLTIMTNAADLALISMKIGAIEIAGYRG
jgi:hypothetical protein